MQFICKNLFLQSNPAAELNFGLGLKTKITADSESPQPYDYQDLPIDAHLLKHCVI
jgi:hypothetical protein